MSKAPSEKIERLPKWAQDHIRAVEAERDAARRTLAEARAEVDGPALAYRDALNREKRWPVAWDEYDAIRFFPYGEDEADGRWIEFRRREPGTVEVMASRTLHIEAQSSNVIRLRTT